MRALLGSIAVIALSVWPSRIEAAPREAMEREAKKACLNGLPAKGVAILTDLYVDTNDPTYIFNQGRCFEQNRRYEDAIGRFREYLLKGDHLSGGEKALAREHIAACQSFLAAGEAAQPQAIPKSPTPSSPAPESSQPVALVEAESAPPATHQAAELAVRAQPTARDDAGSTLRTAGIVTAAVGVVGLATGLAFNLKVNGMASDLSKVDQYDASKDSTRKDYKTLGWIGYGVGATCLAAGAVLYYLGTRGGREATTTALVPTAGPGMAGAAVGGTF